MPDGGPDRLTWSLHGVTALLVACAWMLGDDSEEAVARAQTTGLRPPSTLMAVPVM
jgi:hypothetical protein